MPEETKDAVSQDAPEAQAPPTPEIAGSSGKEGSERIGTDAGRLEETLQSLTSKVESLEERLPDLVDARFKSSKDKNIYKMQRDLEEVRGLIEASGGDFSKVQSRLERDAIEQRFAELEARISGGAGGTAPAQDERERLKDDTAKFLSGKEAELGIALSNDELKQLAGKKEYHSEREWFEELTTALVKKARGQSVSPAAAAQPASKGAMPLSGNDLVAQYNEEKKSLGRGEHAALGLVKLKRKYRDLAKEHDVDFPY